jgi:hypothetical protein
LSLELIELSDSDSNDESEGPLPAVARATHEGLGFRLRTSPKPSRPLKVLLQNDVSIWIWITCCPKQVTDEKEALSHTSRKDNGNSDDGAEGEDEEGEDGEEGDESEDDKYSREDEELVDDEDGPAWNFAANEELTHAPKYTFCPAVHQAQVLHLITRHFCCHPIFKTHSGVTGTAAEIRLSVLSRPG